MRRKIPSALIPPITYSTHQGSDAAEMHKGIATGVGVQIQGSKGCLFLKMLFDLSQALKGLTMIAAQRLMYESFDDQDLSDKNLADEISYFEKKLSLIKDVSDAKANTMRHVYTTLLKHRKEILKSKTTQNS